MMQSGILTALELHQTHLGLFLGFVLFFSLVLNGHCFGVSALHLSEITC